ncbi:hypothetical protein JXA02_14405 [candidate division KSB1 bacterium]|nr:hypothetical protein [candidate division KSB1 bacterium]
MKNCILKICGVFSLLLLLFFSQSPGRSFNFIVMPPIVEEKYKSGSMSKINLTVHNNDSSPLTLLLSTADLTMDLQGKAGIAERHDETFSCKEWFVLPSPRIVIAPNAQVPIPIGIQAPYGAFGGKYGIILLQTELKPRAADEVTLLGQTGTIFLLESAGQKKRSAIIRDVKMTILKAEEVQFHVLVHNDGNVHFRAKGYVLIKNHLDKIVDRAPLQVGTGLVLPAHDRLFQAKWNNKRKMAAGEYRAIVNVQIPGVAKTLQKAISFAI